MNSIDEQLWDYIDGRCTAEAHERISRLILHDEQYRRQYDELMQLHADFSGIELDEPPMAFTYHVMEGIRAQEAAVPLKAGINKYIIRGIAAFFILTIGVLLFMALSQVNWHAGAATVKLPVEVNITQVRHYFNGPVLKTFLFFDLILGMFLLDAYLRKQAYNKHHAA